MTDQEIFAQTASFSLFHVERTFVTKCGSVELDESEIEAQERVSALVGLHP